jgi:hypothetical protein
MLSVKESVESRAAQIALLQAKKAKLEEEIKSAFARARYLGRKKPNLTATQVALRKVKRELAGKGF